MSVDSIVFDIADTAERLGNRHPRLLEEAKTNLHSLLISKLPEKREMKGYNVMPGYNNNVEGFNKAVDDMRKSIDEMFGVKG